MESQPVRAAGKRRLRQVKSLRGLSGRKRKYLSNEDDEVTTSSGFNDDDDDDETVKVERSPSSFVDVHHQRIEKMRKRICLVRAMVDAVIVQLRSIEELLDLEDEIGNHLNK